MKITWASFVFVLAMCMAMSAFAENNPRIHVLRPYDKNHPPGTVCNGRPCDINYRGGPVFEKTPNIYIVYYGNWTAKDESIINYYFEHLGGSTQNKINTTYSDNAGKFVPRGVHYNSATGSYHDNYSLGTNLTDSDVQTIIANAITAGHLPVDTNGIYFVLTYKDVTESSSLGTFCTNYCGYHGPSFSIVSGDVIKYSFVGDTAACPGKCEASNAIGDNKSPNNDPGADGTVSIMWHEFSETASDPEVNVQTAWQGSSCGESGDCCAWIFGNLKKGGNGAHYNETIGRRHYITQTMLQLTSKSLQGDVPGQCVNVYAYPATILHAFKGGTDGAGPLGGVVLDGAGNLYGTTQLGGDLTACPPSGCGTVYKVDPNGNETILYAFTGGTDGFQPLSGLTFDGAGNLYGINYCCVFKLDTSGQFTVLYAQGGVGKLALDGAGNIYGTDGYVFELSYSSKGWMETILYSFTGGTDGDGSSTGVLLGSSGNLYGTTPGGGDLACNPPAGCGTVFSVAPNGKQTVLHAFTGGKDGRLPAGGLLFDSAGNFYGVTELGGDLTCNPPYGCGTVFKIDATGTLIPLYTFDGSINGSIGGELASDTKGNLYGLTYGAGSTLYKIDTNDQPSVLWNFSLDFSGLSGVDANERLAIDAAGNFYGTFSGGGTGNNGDGVVFKVPPVK